MKRPATKRPPDEHTLVIQRDSKRVCFTTITKLANAEARELRLVEYPNGTVGHFAEVVASTLPGGWRWVEISRQVYDSYLADEASSRAAPVSESREIAPARLRTTYLRRVARALWGVVLAVLNR